MAQSLLVAKPSAATVITKSESCTCMGKALQWVIAVFFLNHGSITVMPHVHHGTSNNWQLDCLFSSLFRVRSRKHVCWINPCLSLTSKLCITGPLWENSTNHCWIPLTKGQQCRKCSHCHDHVMSSSCGRYPWHEMQLNLLEKDLGTYAKTWLLIKYV